MPRRLQQAFNCEPLAELTRQLLFAPSAQRIAQLQRTEKLHDEIDTDSAYPLEYLVYRMTHYRPEAGEASVLLVGEAVQPDLRLIIDQLSRSVEIAPDDEPAATIDQLAHRLEVSAKTIHRWRKAGLRWRWVTPPDGGQKYIVIPDAAAKHFTEHNHNRVQRAARYEVMSPADRQRIITRAREVIDAGKHPPTLNRTAVQIATEIGRSLETVRLTLEKHDRASPPQALFSHDGRPLTPRQKRLIERAARRGIATRDIAQRLGRSRHTIHRVLRERRAAAARQIDLRCIHSPTFDREDAEQVILRSPLDARGSLDDAARSASRSITPGSAESTDTPIDTRSSSRHRGQALADDLPEPLRTLYRQPVIPAARQRTLFVRYNYLKFKAGAVRAEFHPRTPRARDLDRFDALVAEARQMRAVLVRANLPVVLSVARRHLIGEPAAQGGHLLELLETGQQMLLEAIESYNAAWSHTFASYLTNRLLKHFAQAETILRPETADSAIGAEDPPHGETQKLTAAKNDSDPPRPQARRRRSAEQIHQRLVAHAREHGIDLGPPPSEPAARDA